MSVSSAVPVWELKSLFSALSSKFMLVKRKHLGLFFKSNILSFDKGSIPDLKFLIQYFIGRNSCRRKSCRKKMLWGKSCNFHNFFYCSNLIFHNFQLFHLQQYNFSQFASFSSCNIYSKGSNRCHPSYKFFDFFAPPLSSWLLLLIPTPSVYYFFEFAPAKFFVIHIDWCTCKILSNLGNFPYFNSCLGVAFI